MTIDNDMTFWKVAVHVRGRSPLPCRKHSVGKMHNIPTEVYDIQGEVGKVYISL